MNKFILPLAALLLCSCATVPSIPPQTTKDLQNVSYIKTLEGKPHVKWVRILTVAYSSGGLNNLTSRIYCVVCSDSGVIVALDGRSQNEIFGNGINPVEVADQLLKGVVFAWYEE